ncbi:MAG: MBL fold metallo-hydrolase [Bacteroidales bacterium]|nr:MBL fold metallo-hydrolase [Bacteroidales bacterium]MBQ9701655.1 MBL fold metallo-hydrolase [Bacteroidales bacterium]
MIHSRIFTFNPLGTNCAVIWADGQGACTLVDPGMSSDDGVKDLTDYMEREGLRPDAILLTHGHFDHVWGVEKLLSRYDIPVYMHPADKEILADCGAVFSGLPKSFKVFQHHFATVDISDGDVITTAGTPWTVIHTPGHTPGGVCYYSAQNSLLLSGDTLFAGSIGRTDLGGGDYDALMQSILKKLLVLPGDTDVIPGHGQPTTIAREGMSNPFLQPFNNPDGDFPEEGIAIDGFV